MRTLFSTLLGLALSVVSLTARDGAVVITEVHYHPAGDNSALEFVELYNQLAVDVDLSNWLLSGVGFDFPEGTVLGGREYLVVAKNPATLQAATGITDALGPYPGLLMNSGETLRLYNNNRSFRSKPGGDGSPGEVLDDLEGRRIIEEVAFSDTYPWPVGPDGSGFTLSKVDPATASNRAENWTVSIQEKGTPGAANVFSSLPAIAINETSAATGTSFQLELFNYGGAPRPLGGLVVSSSDPFAPDYVFPESSLAAGSYLTVDAVTLGFIPTDNNRVFLYSAGKSVLIDAVRVDNFPKARFPDGTGPWLRPTTETFGAANQIDLEDGVVINEIFYHAYPQTSPYAPREEEWIELYNRGSSGVDLSGWTLGGGIEYDFPFGTVIPSGGYLVVAKDALALAGKHPAVTVIGNYSKQLGDGGDALILKNAAGNPVDEVRYYDSGPWPAAADGGGSSLELRDPDADNGAAGSWAPSDESSRSSWQTYSYQGVAVDDGIGNNVFHELQIGLLDAGEFLLDDVSVVETGGGEFIQNGNFEADAIGAVPNKWRVLGTHGSHGRTVVVTDPTNPQNQCLHVVATGPTENKHNKIETTFANNEQVVLRRTYTITFRAKWLGGSNQLNSRLYFNYLQRTHHLQVPTIWGSPGIENTARVPNHGPALSGFQHSPVVPDANERVRVTVNVSDLDGIQDVTLYYSINGGSYQSVATRASSGGAYSGSIPGQGASSIVRFYVEARDALGATTYFPPTGGEGGAFYKVDDGFADTSGVRHNFRIVMANSDRQFLFLNTNRMSNDRFPVTVIEDEQTAYYDVELRLKGSASGRYLASNYGFNIRFHSDRLFRGTHDTVSVERGQDLKDLLAKHLTNRAGGGSWSFYDDVAYIIPPTTGDRGVGELSMTRHTGNFFDGLFPDADDPGTLFNLELLYSPNGTSGGPEGLKIGNPYNNTNGQYDLNDRGDDKETYRWGYQIRSARDRDDYSAIIALNQAMELDGAALKAAMDPLIDVNQWMRTFAMMSLNGTDDVFSRIWEHNFRYYVRPTDGKIIVMQWDLDRAFGLATNASVIPTVNRQGTPVMVAKLFTIPRYRRLFDGHLDDLIQTTFNSTYVGPWASHLTSVTGYSFNEYTNYLTNRANFVQGTLPSPTPFEMTTNGGNDFSEPQSSVTLAGNAWVDVFAIQVNGVSVDLDWSDADSWVMTVPIALGPNFLVLTAFDNRGVMIGSETITVTNTGSVDLANASNTVISELHYHPADPSASEIAAGFTDADLFEFVELANVSATTTIDLTNVHFTDGVTFTFPGGMVIAPGERVVVVANVDAFEFRYGGGAAFVVGSYTGNFRNSGEQVRLEAADTSLIFEYAYGDDLPWSPDADGGGYSLILFGSDPNQALSWRSSVAVGGNPGTSDSTPYSGGDLLEHALASEAFGEMSGDLFVMNVRVNLSSDDCLVSVEFSQDLETWVPALEGNLISRVNHGDGTATLRFGSPQAVDAETRQLGRVRVTFP